MSDQLIWICSACGITARIPASASTVHCACGHVARASGKPLNNQPVADEVAVSRAGACRVCCHYGNLRCSRIDLGCRKSYLRAVDSPTGQCPLGKWPIA